MDIRKYIENDTVELCDLYYNTIHLVNKADYTQDELEAWAPSNSYDEASYKKDIKRWNAIKPFIAVKDNVIVGFAELEEGGHINCFFVHHEYQGQGVGTQLLDACIQEARERGYGKIFAEVSITSRPFCEKRGFTNAGPILCDIQKMKMKFYNMEMCIK